MNIYLYDESHYLLVNTPVDFPVLPRPGELVQLPDGVCRPVENLVHQIGNSAVQTVQVILGSAVQ
jgi:hypothetical protein